MMLCQKLRDTTLLPPVNNERPTCYETVDMLEEKTLFDVRWENQIQKYQILNVFTAYAHAYDAFADMH